MDTSWCGFFVHITISRFRWLSCFFLNLAIPFSFVLRWHWPCFRLSSLGMGWDPELSSPSPRYSSYTSYSPSSLPPSSSTSLAYRRNSTIDLPIIRQTSTHELPPPSIRRSSTLDRPRDYSASRAGSVVRSTEPENRAMSPSYSRYTSTLDDTGDWGFSTLRRRNSRQSGSRPSFPNDDIRF